MFGELTPRVFRRNIYTGRGRCDALSRPPRTVKTRVTDDDPFADDRYRAFYPSIEREIIEQSARIVALSVPTIELAGGSVRCMLAGIHLARRP